MVEIIDLQSQVDQVKTDLESLKKETSEEVKEKKTQETQQKINTTKEAISKKLAELEALNDATMATDIQKLKDMLLSLETSTTEISALKQEVVAPVDPSKETPKTPKDEK